MGGPGEKLLRRRARQSARDQLRHSVRRNDTRIPQVAGEMDVSVRNDGCQLTVVSYQRTLSTRSQTRQFFIKHFYRKTYSKPSPWRFRCKSSHAGENCLHPPPPSIPTASTPLTA